MLYLNHEKPCHSKILFRKGGMPLVRTFAAFKRMLGIFYLYAAKLIEPPVKKQLPPAPKVLWLQTQTKE